MAGPVSDRNWIASRSSRNSSKALYDINGMSRPSGIAHRGQQMQVLSEEIITESDRQLQELLKKQMNTTVSLNHLLSRRKEFSEATISQPLVNSISGAMTMDGYEKWVQNSEEIDRLRQAGLTEEEIAIKLHNQKNSTVQCVQKRKSRFGVDPVMMAKRVKEIDRKLDEYEHRLSQPTKFSGAKVISRQEMDLEQAITKNREKSKHFACLVTDGSRSDALHPNHPINHLEEILEKVSSTLSSRAKKGSEHLQECKVNAKRNQSQSEESDSDESVIQGNFDVPNRPEGWEIASEVAPASEVDPVVLLPDGTKALQGSIESIPDDVIQRYKLTVEEIRALPRFKHYTPGEPNQTIYLKNLSSRVSEADIVALFHRFQKPDEPKIVYRLLKGRMKGQAFVKFNSTEVASAALNLVNGYDFKGKPIIIEYGKQKISTTENNEQL